MDLFIIYLHNYLCSSQVKEYWIIFLKTLYKIAEKYIPTLFNPGKIFYLNLYILYLIILV